MNEPLNTNEADGGLSDSNAGLGFDDALRIARGCKDYGGGYIGDHYEIFQHGIQTVVNALSGAREKGLADSQIKALHKIGA